MNEVKDRVGNLITPGCYIAYGIRCVNSGDLKIGIVKEIKFIEKNYFDNCSNSIRVRGIDNWTKEPSIGGGDGYLGDTDKIIVLNTLPKPYKNLLDNHYAKYIKNS